LGKLSAGNAAFQGKGDRAQSRSGKRAQKIPKFWGNLVMAQWRTSLEKGIVRWGGKKEKGEIN